MDNAGTKFCNPAEFLYQRKLMLLRQDRTVVEAWLDAIIIAIHSSAMLELDYSRCSTTKWTNSPRSSQLRRFLQHIAVIYKNVLYHQVLFRLAFNDYQRPLMFIVRSRRY